MLFVYYFITICLYLFVYLLQLLGLLLIILFSRKDLIFIATIFPKTEASSFLFRTYILAEITKPLEIVFSSCYLNKSYHNKNTHLF